MLGDMHATIRSIDQNVSAMRGEFSTMAARLGEVETDLAAIKAERSAMLPEYLAFIHKVRNHLQDYDSWKGRVEGSVATAKSGGRMMQGLLAAALTVILFLTGQIWMDRRNDAIARPTASQPVHAVN
jgi:hypothetical protein